MLEPLPIVVLISGRGSNLRAIVDKTTQGEIPAQIRAVVSNRPRAAGLEYAREAHILTEILDHTLFPDRESFDQALHQLISRHEPELILLAGFMRVLTRAFVQNYHGRILNIHPSLLPAFRGLHTHERALAAGADTHGASVHFVTEKLDSGPIILQAPVPVLADDEPKILAERVLALEHQIYPLAVKWFAQGRLALRDGHVQLDGRALSAPLIYEDGKVT